MRKREKLNVGAGPVSAHKENGITLVALIITIIVMLILVGVSVQVVINSNLIGTAQDAADRTETQYLEESKAGSLIEIEGKKYLSMEDYVAGIERAPDIMEGEGTETNPYTIDSVEALVQFAHSVTNGKTYEGEHVKLTRNLDFKSADSYLNATRTDYAEYGYTGELMTALTEGEGWQPIGATNNNNNDSSNCFKGIFDGNGKNINNLLINKNIQELEQGISMGLFSRSYGTIQNLGLKNVNVNIVAGGNAGKAVNVGIIVGENWAEINGCYATGSIYVEDSGTCTVRVGGLASYLKPEASIINCYNIANISTKHYSTGGYYVGGISSYCNANATISGCYNVGTIDGNLNTTTKYAYCGGIVGRTDSVINNSYNLGDIEVVGTVKNMYAGGFTGEVYGNTNNICNIGNVVSNVTATGNNLVGGIIGYNSYTGVIENSYNLSSTASSGIGKDRGTTDVTTVDSIEDMPTVLSVVGAAFKTDTNNINGGYPILNWQSSTNN